MTLQPDGAAVRIVAVVLLFVFVSLAAFGIVYVPRHDGRVVDTLLLVMLPAAGTVWCLVELLPRRGQIGQRKDQ